ncbi:MAG TPA: DUF1330 domain-containing protein [Vitreimonas sp.]|nr:DUF1330 domain-containing protein [Vitreimonas sp.]
MTVYAIAQLKIHDRPLYNRYLERFMDVLKQHKGSLLAADDSPRVLRGDVSMDKVVLLSFDSEEQFRAWGASPEYVEISKDRDASSEATILFVKGID